MDRKEIVIYSLVIILLVVGIIKFWPIKKESYNKNNISQLASEKVVQRVKDSSTIETVNISGVVHEWSGVSNKLLVDADGARSEFEIISGQTKVTVVQSQNIYKATQMYGITKEKQPLHWQQAFCPGDAVSLLLNKTSGEVEWIMNTGKRMCGFKGDFL